MQHFAANVIGMPKIAQPPRRRGRPPVYRVPQTGTRVVKKYGNRRLYDTRASCYINLDELLDLFSAEEELQVLDAMTGEDLTERTLRQALLAEESVVPPLLLRAFLRYRTGAVRMDFERHLARAVARFAARSERAPRPTRPQRRTAT
jgi:polyhydroxyalkanoate synthesis repressor PhaR